jgi:hypothetical protein
MIYSEAFWDRQQQRRVREEETSNFVFKVGNKDKLLEVLIAVAGVRMNQEDSFKNH